MKIDLYTQSGEKKGQIEVPESIFDIPFNKDLVHQALVMQLANKRVAIAHTKTRGDVRGGGKKPWKQKGTGRARAGTSRSPLWKGGAVLFGPRNDRNFAKEMPRKQRRKAMFCALSEKARNNEVMALEDFQISQPKTKEFFALLQKLPVEKDVLVVLPEKNEVLQKSIRNLPNAKAITARYVNIHDLQKFEKVLILKDSIAKMEEVFLNASK